MFFFVLSTIISLLISTTAKGFVSSVPQNILGQKNFIRMFIIVCYFIHIRIDSISISLNCVEYHKVWSLCIFQ